MDNQRRVIALGFFDGVHLGHGALLRRVAQRAAELDARPCAFTFDQSPAAALTGRAVPLLTGVDDRAGLMETLYGIREVIVAPFARLRDMDWRDFVGSYLRGSMGPSTWWRAMTSTSAGAGRGTPSGWRRSAPAWA